MFRDGEMSIQGGNGLTATVNRYGQELAVLAQKRFRTFRHTGGKISVCRAADHGAIAIVQGLLGVRPVAGQRDTWKLW